MDAITESNAPAATRLAALETTYEIFIVGERCGPFSLMEMELLPIEPAMAVWVSYAPGEEPNPDGVVPRKASGEPIELPPSRAGELPSLQPIIQSQLLRRKELKATLSAQVRAQMEEAESGYFNRCFHIADNFRLGKSGFPLNRFEAFRFFSRGSHQTTGASRLLMGMCMESGGEGLLKSQREAARWYRSSAESGNAEGMVRFGKCLGLGIGVARNSIEASAWFRKAAEKGNAETTGEIDLKKSRPV